MFQINDSWFFCLWFFFQNYIAIINTKERSFYLCEKTLECTCWNWWLVAYVCVDTRNLIRNWWWMKIYFYWKVSQSNVSKSQNSCFQSTSSLQTWWPLRLRRGKGLSCLLNLLLSGIKKFSTYKNYFRCKTIILSDEVLRYNLK